MRRNLNKIKEALFMVSFLAKFADAVLFYPKFNGVK